MLGPKLPHTISNICLYNRTNKITWSKKIKERHLKWLGHLLRIHDDALGRTALDEALRPTKRSSDKAKTNWTSTINKDIDENKQRLNLGSNELKSSTEDRHALRAAVALVAHCRPAAETRHRKRNIKQ